MFDASRDCFCILTFTNTTFRGMLASTSIQHREPVSALVQPKSNTLAKTWV